MAESEDKAEGEEGGDFLEQVPSDVEDLDMTHYRLRVIPALARFTQLRTICMRQNLISDMQPLSLLTAECTELDLYDNRITDIQGLAHLTQLTYISPTKKFTGV